LLSFSRFSFKKFFSENILNHYSQQLKTKIMEMTGRVTADAKVTETKNGKKVTNFSIAINDRIKTKDGEMKKLTTYVNCAYWINSGLASYLSRGTLVELTGRIGVNVWKNTDGEPKGVITLHVNNIKLHGKTNNMSMVNENSESTEIVDDLPF
jgi:single-strand DNA-binding protein